MRMQTLTKSVGPSYHRTSGIAIQPWGPQTSLQFTWHHSIGEPVLPFIEFIQHGTRRLRLVEVPTVNRSGKEIHHHQTP